MTDILIKDMEDFGTYNLCGIHQIVDSEWDIDNAYENAERDNFKRIIFYFRFHEGHECDFDFQQLIDYAKNRNEY